jgi:hypothetical protein
MHDNYHIVNARYRSSTLRLRTILRTASYARASTAGGIGRDGVAVMALSCWAVPVADGSEEVAVIGWAIGRKVQCNKVQWHSC